MYNTDIPNRAELPSGKQLLRSTLIALVVAIVILVTVVLPAEYGIDPTKIGRVLGLTQMGEIKVALAGEAERDRQSSSHVPEAPSVKPPVNDVPGLTESRRDEITVTLKPGEGAEIKLEMTKGAKVKYDWTVSGGVVNYDTHGDNPQINYHGYGKGQQKERDTGELTADFDGKHGWFWRNRGNSEVTITLKTEGEYKDIRRVV